MLRERKGNLRSLSVVDGAGFLCVGSVLLDPLNVNIVHGIGLGNQVQGRYNQAKQNRVKSDTLPYSPHRFLLYMRLSEERAKSQTGAWRHALTAQPCSAWA